MVGMLSVCYRFEFGIVGLLSVSIPALCWWSVSNRCYVGYLSVSNRAIPYRILSEMSPTRTRLVLRCLQQHCRWPTAGRLIENFAVLSVWPVWLPVALPSSDDQTGNQCYRHIQPSLKQGLNCRPGPCIGTAGAVSANRVPCTVGSQVPCKARPVRW